MLSHCIAAIVLIGLSSHVRLTDAQDEKTTTLPPRFREMEKNDLILLNVAAKGRVVELLANELARTEIIRALLVEYAKECVENVTVLEKHCLDCMMDRCQNRMSECEINSPPLTKLISHSPSEIQGLQFLSKSPRDVDKHMREFANKARTDILKGVPESLRKESETIMHNEVDQSLKDLDENMNSDKAIKKISVHVQKAANNVHKIPAVGEKIGTIIIENEGHAVNIAELLAKQLKDSRPFIDSISHNGAVVMEQMPTIMEQVDQKVSAFKEKIGGVFSRIMDKFQRNVNDPDTDLENDNMQDQNGFPSNMNPNGPQNVNMQMSPRFQQQIPGRNPPGSPGGAFPPPGRFGPRRGQFNQIQNGQFQQQMLQGPIPQGQFQGLGPNQQFQGQFNPNANFQGQFQDQQFLDQMALAQANQQIQNVIPQNVQPQVQVLQQPKQQLGPSGQSQQIQGQQISNQIPQGDVGKSDSSGNQASNQQQQQMQQQIQQQMQQQQLQQQQQIQQQIQQQQIQQQLQQQQIQQQLKQRQQLQQQQLQNQNGIPGSQSSAQAQSVPNPTIQGRAQNVQGQGQSVQQSQRQAATQGRKKRHIDAECGKLELDPETYCKTYESQCHNCTLEKRLRFEVCGEGVEKARDEIKRFDISVGGYLKSYDDHVIGGPLVLKVELNDRNRLHKTNSYYDAFITAKIGPSIFRYKSKMILNVHDIRTSGSQIGDELWEKLWENKVFQEARKIEIAHKDNSMGQIHHVKVHTAEAHAHAHSTGSVSSSSWSCLFIGVVSTLMTFVF